MANWISVHERLPEEKKFLQFSEGSEVFHGYFYIDNEDQWFSGPHTILDIKDATHWRYIDTTPPKPTTP